MRNTRKTDWKHLRHEDGIALLFVVLLTSALMIVTIGITTIAYKETFFSVEARDSARAFFAADTGMECALYLDKTGTFPGSAGTAAAVPGTCQGITISPAATTNPLGSLDFYQFMLPIGTSGCATVTVDKNIVPATATGSYTQVSSFGYNIPPGPGSVVSCIAAGATPGRRVVTRALQTQYENP